MRDFLCSNTKEIVNCFGLECASLHLYVHNLSNHFAACSTHLLFSSRIIEQVYKTRRLLTLALAQQWFGVQVASRSWSDMWILFGIAGYLTDTYLVKALGSNDVKDRFIRVRLFSSLFWYNNRSLMFGKRTEYGVCLPESRKYGSLRNELYFT